MTCRFGDGWDPQASTMTLAVFRAFCQLEEDVAMLLPKSFDRCPFKSAQAC